MPSHRRLSQQLLLLEAGRGCVHGGALAGPLDHLPTHVTIVIVSVEARITTLRQISSFLCSVLNRLVPIPHVRVFLGLKHLHRLDLVFDRVQA